MAFNAVFTKYRLNVVNETCFTLAAEEPYGQHANDQHPANFSAHRLILSGSTETVINMHKPIYRGFPHSRIGHWRNECVVPGLVDSCMPEKLVVRLFRDIFAYIGIHECSTSAAALVKVIVDPLLLASHFWSFESVRPLLV